MLQALEVACCGDGERPWINKEEMFQRAAPACEGSIYVYIGFLEQSSVRGSR